MTTFDKAFIKRATDTGVTYPAALEALQLFKEGQSAISGKSSSGGMAPPQAAKAPSTPMGPTQGGGGLLSMIKQRLSSAPSPHMPMQAPMQPQAPKPMMPQMQPQLGMPPKPQMPMAPKPMMMPKPQMGMK